MGILFTSPEKRNFHWTVSWIEYLLTSTSKMIMMLNKMQLWYLCCICISRRKSASLKSPRKKGYFNRSTQFYPKNGHDTTVHTSFPISSFNPFTFISSLGLQENIEKCTLFNCVLSCLVHFIGTLHKRLWESIFSQIVVVTRGMVFLLWW